MQLLPSARCSNCLHKGQRRIREKDQPRNGMVQRTQGAILLGPSGNAQGGHKFFTLTTGKVVIRWAWLELPTSVAVIERVNPTG